MSAANDPVLAAQLRYYRARAAEYDVGSYGGERSAVPSVAAAIEPLGDVLELACGTGVWTRELAPRATSYVAVDAAPEMLALAAVALEGSDVEFVQSDVFDLALPPGRDFDTVFFSFWISHVPPERFAEFWAAVGRVLRPGGHAVFVDELPSRAVYETERDGTLATRTLADGSRHQVVKVFWDPADLTTQLGALGWTATVTPAANDWFVGDARRVAAQRQG